MWQTSWSLETASSSGLASHDMKVIEKLEDSTYPAWAAQKIDLCPLMEEQEPCHGDSLLGHADLFLTHPQHNAHGVWQYHTSGPLRLSGFVSWSQVLESRGEACISCDLSLSDIHFRLYFQALVKKTGMKSDNLNGSKDPLRQNKAQNRHSFDMKRAPFHSTRALKDVQRGPLLERPPIRLWRRKPYPYEAGIVVVRCSLTPIL